MGQLSSSIDWCYTGLSKPTLDRDILQIPPRDQLLMGIPFQYIGVPISNSVFRIYLNAKAAELNRYDISGCINS